MAFLANNLMTLIKNQSTNRKFYGCLAASTLYLGDRNYAIGASLLMSSAISGKVVTYVGNLMSSYRSLNTKKIVIIKDCLYAGQVLFQLFAMYKAYHYMNIANTFIQSSFLIFVTKKYCNAMATLILYDIAYNILAICGMSGIICCFRIIKNRIISSLGLTSDSFDNFYRLLTLIATNVQNNRNFSIAIGGVNVTGNSNNTIANTISEEELEKVSPNRFPALQNMNAITIDESNDTCSVCQENINMTQMMRILNCKHLFHTTCVDPWILRSSATCPLCRTSVIPSV